MTTLRSARAPRHQDSQPAAGPDTRPARAILAGILAALVAVGTWGAAIAPLEVHAADAEAPGGRLIVTWRGGLHPAGPGGSVALPASARVLPARMPNARQFVVTAAPGTAAAVAASLRADPDVASVVPDSILHVADWPASGAPDDPYYTAYQADLSLIRVPDAWRTTTGTPSTIVAIIDTGLTTGNPDLAGVAVVDPFNEITGTADVTDANGHGTHIAGTIAARTNNGVGVAGIAPGASIMPVKVCDDDGNCWNSDVLAGVDYAVAHGASVINVSLGAPLNAAGIAAFQPTYDDAARAGVVVVAAAGNTGDGAIEYPAAFNHVISVAATDSATTNPDAVASFSTHNAYVDIAAPGVAIVSTLPDGTYGYMSGTSMAAPHVAAVAALVRSAHPSWTVVQVESAIEQTAVDLGGPGRDDAFGYGRVDAAAAIDGGVTPAPTPTPVATPTPAPTPTPLPTPSQGPEPSPSPIPSPTPGEEPGPTPTPTPTPDPNVGPTPTPVVRPAPVSPRVSRVTPRTTSTSVARSFHPRVTFSVPVTGISVRTVILTDVTRGTKVRLRVTYSAVTRTATLIPAARLTANHRYRISVTRVVAALEGGRRLALTFTATFRTGLR